ncbi:hypothetical protein QUF80_03735 [Desulfococcaceae bacterium HSG8]|nr:hypothetical protein [Desulfococcaceae bacterium HSG8]
MKWQEIRTYYPQQWLLIELEQIAVVDTFADSLSITNLNVYVGGKDLQNTEGEEFISFPINIIPLKFFR